jgi:hypothetical protein
MYPDASGSGTPTRSGRGWKGCPEASGFDGVLLTVLSVRTIRHLPLASGGQSGALHLLARSIGESERVSRFRTDRQPNDRHDVLWKLGLDPKLSTALGVLLGLVSHAEHLGLERPGFALHLFRERIELPLLARCRLIEPIAHLAGWILFRIVVKVI